MTYLKNNGIFEEGSACGFVGDPLGGYHRRFIARPLKTDMDFLYQFSSFK
jgi:hypothetical protein